MSFCSRYPCGWYGNGCSMQNCPQNQGAVPSFPVFIPPTPSPRTMPVNIPFSHIGLTIVTLDGYGNVSIKVDQPYPKETAE